MTAADDGTVETDETDRLIAAICRSIRERPGDLGVLVDAEVRRVAPLATAAERDRLITAATARLAGLGQLDELLADPTIDEVLVTGDRVWIDRGGRLHPAGTLVGTTVGQVIERILAPIGRRVDRTSPIVDARLASGARVCAVVAPVAVGGSTLSIRRFADTIRPLDDFTDPAGRALLAEIVSRRCNAVVCGATSSGKTSLLASLVDSVDPTERLIILEDTTELPCRAPHVVRLEARPPSVEGVAPVTVGDLVRTALRLRPDRLVVGEVRGDEVLGLVQAMNTGHDGSFSTCHANSSLDALLRLESLVLQAAPQWPLAAVRLQLARSIDVIVQVERVGASRRIVSIDEVVVPDPSDPRGDGTPSVRTLGTLDAGRFTTIRPLERFRR